MAALVGIFDLSVIVHTLKAIKKNLKVLSNIFSKFEIRILAKV